MLSHICSLNRLATERGFFLTVSARLNCGRRHVHQQPFPCLLGPGRAHAGPANQEVFKGRPIALTISRVPICRNDESVRRECDKSPTTHDSRSSSRSAPPVGTHDWPLFAVAPQRCFCPELHRGRLVAACPCACRALAPAGPVRI